MQNVVISHSGEGLPGWDACLARRRPTPLPIPCLTSLRGAEELLEKLRGAAYAPCR